MMKILDPYFHELTTGAAPRGRGADPCCQKHKIKAKDITEEEMVDLLGDSIGRDGENSGSLFP